MTINPWNTPIKIFPYPRLNGRSQQKDVILYPEGMVDLIKVQPKSLSFVTARQSGPNAVKLEQKFNTLGLTTI